MTELPRDPDQFAEQVATLLRDRRPSLEVDLLGPRELLVNGRRLDLDNLYRMVSHEPDRGAEIVDAFVGQIEDQGFEVSTMTWEDARSRVMPRIQPRSIFEHLSEHLVAHVPFVNDTVIVFVIDLPHMTVSITTEQLERWGVDEDDLDEIARTNLAEYAPDLELELIESRDGGRAVIIAEQDGYDAARLLLDDLYRKLAPMMGGDFYVATPARDMMIAISLGPSNFVSRIGRRVQEDHTRLPYPITPDFFYVTRDGVAGRVDRMDFGLAA